MTSAGILDEALFLFDLQGYVVLPAVLTGAEVDELNALIDARGLPEPGTSLESQLFSGYLGWGPPFRALLDHHRVMPFVRSILGDHIRLDRCYGIRMRTGTRGLPLHGGKQDVEDDTEFFRVSDGRMLNGVTTVSWALTDMLSGDGGFACIPGSHKSNYGRPQSWCIEDDVVCQVPLRAGDVVVFTGAIAHGTKPWHARHERRSLLFKYAPGHLAWSCGYLDWPPDLRRELSPAQAALLEPPRGRRINGQPRPQFMDPEARTGG